MPSPFPGMNPYLEQPGVWRDFHESFIAAARVALTPHLVPRYFARIEATLYIRERPDRPPEPFGAADVSVHPEAVATARQATTAAPAATAPATVGLPPRLQTERLSHLRVIDAGTREVVTVVELLSPSNKYAGPDREQYLEKQARVLQSWTSLVEIDLLRGGPRMPWADMPACDYNAVVSRPTDRSRADFWPIRLRDPLPAVPVPLAPGEPEPRLDLQALLHQIYDGAGYRYFLYAHPPAPRLAPDDDAWAAALVAGHLGGS